MNPFILTIWKQPGTRHLGQRLHRLGQLAALCLLLALQAGCLSRPALNKQLFLVSLPTPPVAEKPLSDTLGFRLVTVAPQFEGRSLIYRLSESGYELDAYAEFLIPPDRMLGSEARAWMRRSGLFRDVTEPSSLVSPSRVAELHVVEMYGDFQKPNAPAAVFTIRFVLLTPGDGQSGAQLAKVYSRRIPLKERTASGVVAGFREGFAQCLVEVGEDLAKLKWRDPEQN